MPSIDWSDLDDLGEGDCICRYFGRYGNDPDAYWRIDRDCPIHGEERSPTND